MDSINNALLGSLFSVGPLGPAFMKNIMNEYHHLLPVISEVPFDWSKPLK